MTTSIIAQALIPLFWWTAPAPAPTAGEQLSSEVAAHVADGMDLIDVDRTADSIAFTFADPREPGEMATRLAVFASGSGELIRFEKTQRPRPKKLARYRDVAAVVAAVTNKVPTHYDLLVRDAGIAARINAFEAVHRSVAGPRSGEFAARWLGGHLQDGGYITAVREDLFDNGAEVETHIELSLETDDERTTVRMILDGSGKPVAAQLIDNRSDSDVSLEWRQRKKTGNALIAGKRIDALSIEVHDGSDDDSDGDDGDDSYGMFQASLSFTLADGTSFTIELVEQEEHGC